MDVWISYLTSHPIIGVALAAALILFIIMVVARLLKWAIVSFIILALAVGLTYKIAQPKKIIDRIQEDVESVSKTGAEKVTDKLQKSAEEAVEKVKESLKKE
ncbi:MAG TPA: hypothetical protein P5268_01995 [Candidatus Marinimicrobia bacterium]|nr:hypothetical protein [Candidatus Neomarinimicrobiota bacterium]HRS50871.1 hypothetical protein [Candidatus Neomarinimicrobiota bacterium]HRU91787.1 hypothetical protein [Candidatus Neomarinimicrobiota bacterium]